MTIVAHGMSHSSELVITELNSRVKFQSTRAVQFVHVPILHRNVNRPVDQTLLTATRQAIGMV